MKTSNRSTTLQLPALLKQPGRHRDGDGLILLVRPNGTAFWIMRYMLRGKARELGLGPLRLVNLAEARARARQARQALLDKVDPVAVKQMTATAARLASLKTITFKEAAERFLQTDAVQNLSNDRHRKQWFTTLAQVFPTIGALPLVEIDTAIILRTLLPIWSKTPETASRLRGRMERVFAWAKAHKLFHGENPASLAVLQDALPSKPKQKHHPAMRYAVLPAFMADLRQRDSISARALEFTILTATRTSETLGAKWSEIDLDSSTWTVPASRMKTRREHRVPLTHRAIALLRSLPRKGEYVFGAIRPLGPMAMGIVLKQMAPGYTVHGFRSSFSDWCRDRTAWSRDVVEMALAHTIKDKSEAAYRRGDALDKRRRLMGEWARYCEGHGTGADVVPLRA